MKMSLPVDPVMFAVSLPPPVWTLTLRKRFTCAYRPLPVKVAWAGEIFSTSLPGVPVRFATSLPKVDVAKNISKPIARL